MSKKNKITMTRPDDFAEVEQALSSAIEQLDDANSRIEALLQEQHAPDASPTPSEEATGGEDTPGEDTQQAE